MSTLPVQPAYTLEDSNDGPRWLVEGLWGDQAVGIVGGEPKLGKSFLALDLAISVASGTACLGRFHPARTGRVLLYPAEDALPIVRQRLEGICLARGAELRLLDLQVITAPALRLDLPQDQQRLLETVDLLRPLLLVLDPFVRLHRVNENDSGEVAPILAYLRELQRRYDLAVAVVHHAKKGAAHERAGQALRGSSEFHAWGDSNLYLRRTRDQLSLTVEHRAAPSKSGIALALNVDAEAVALQVVDSSGNAASASGPSVTERVEHALAQANTPLTIVALRKSCRMRTSNLTHALWQLIRDGRVLKSPEGYRLAAHA